MSRALGRYELLRPLARGGMAEVYLARRRAAGIEKWLVVKRMRPERTGDPRFLDLFVREARLSMSLAHQNIVPVFDFGRIDDQVFLAMERVEGKDLGSSLSRAPDHRLPPLLAAFVAAECCQALDYAHQRKSPDGVALGIVHRDVTPRNVLLSWSGEVKLTDFGIAALAGDATSRLLGTPQYMAPEQARSEPIDPRADIYAIGLVLREAITGVRPRPGSDRDAMLEAARRGELVPWPHLPIAPAPDAELALGSGDHGEPAERPEAPPPALIAIIDRATAIAPADRYPDARSMLEDLDAFIVADRAAHKGESPARQLALWLAGVWAGARDDADSDAAIHAEHLVSFLDDGAMDVIGTGTMRSLAATAAEDVQGNPHAAPAPGAAGAADAAGATGAPAAVDAAPAPIAKATVIAGPGAAPPHMPALGAAGSARPERTARASRISSSTSTVASGSFHTIPTAGEVGRPGRSRGRGQRLRPVASLVVVAAAAGGIVFWVMNNVRGTGPAGDGPPRTAPGTGAPEAAPISGRTGSAPGAEPSGTAAGTGPTATADPATVRPVAGAVADPSVADPPGAEPSGAEPLVAGHGAAPSTGPSSPGHSGAREPGTGRSGAAQPGTAHKLTAPDGGPSGPRPGPHTGAARPEIGPPGTAGQPDRTAAGAAASRPGPDGGSGSAGSGSDRERPATCRVRINLTPWAYYTTDEDATRRETPGTVDLTPGPHRVHVWNPELHVERDIMIQVPADRDTMNYSEPLQPTSLPADAGLP